VRAHPSGLKHGVSAEAGVHAAKHSVFAADIDDHNPERQLRLGFGPDGRLLELVVFRFDSATSFSFMLSGTFAIS
jgi:hypothetical protein